MCIDTQYIYIYIYYHIIIYLYLYDTLYIYMCVIYIWIHIIYILYRYGYTCVCVSFRPSKSRCQVDGNMDLEQVLSTWTKALTGMSALVVDYEGYFSWDSQVTMG